MGISALAEVWISYSGMKEDDFIEKLREALTGLAKELEEEVKADTGLGRAIALFFGDGKPEMCGAHVELEKADRSFLGMIYSRDFDAEYRASISPWWYESFLGRVGIDRKKGLAFLSFTAKYTWEEECVELVPALLARFKKHLEDEFGGRVVSMKFAWQSPDDLEALVDEEYRQLEKQEQVKHISI